MADTQNALPIRLSAAAKPFASDLVRAEVPAGGSVLEILTGQGLLRQACDATVWLDDWCVPRARWAEVLPRPGQLLSVRALPAGGGGQGGKNALRIVATLVIVAISVWTGQVYGAQLAAPLGTSVATATALTTAAVSSVGMMALNMLIPPPKLSADQMEKRYSIDANNAASPYGLVPVPLGRHRWAPRYAAKPYTEVVGEDQYVRILFDLGPGPLEIDRASMRLGDTPLSDYSDVELEIRQGFPGDAPIALFPGTVEELGQGVGLPQGVLRQKDGWITRAIDQDADELSLDFIFPTGVWRTTGGGNRKPTEAAVECQYAPVGTENWTAFPTDDSFSPGVLRVYAETDNSLLRRGTRVAVARGKYQVRVRRLIDHDGNSKYSDSMVWAAARAVLNEAPLKTRVPHALVAMRIRASGQINGTVSNFNLIATRICPDYDAATGTWVERPTRNPASLFLWVARGPANLRPAADHKIDWPTLAAWHEACAAAGYTYDAVLDGAGTVFERLKQIAAVGRAQFQVRDAKYSVVRDVPQDVPVTVITPRNSWGFKFTRLFADIPHALRCRFADEKADYKTAERLVFDDGYSEANATLYEVLDLPGLTNADQVHKAGRYHLAQLRLRPSIYELNQDVESLIVRRGDRVDVQHDVMLVGLSSGRITGIGADRLSIEADEACPMEEGKRYALRIRHTLGVTEVPLTTVPGEATRLQLTSALPAAVKEGDLFAFGEAGRVTVPLLVKGIYPGADLTAKLELVDLAPEIHQADAGIIPPFDPGIVIDRLPAPTGFTLSTDLVMQGGAWVTRLDGRWNPLHLDDRRVDRYVLQLKSPAGDWRTVTPDTPTGFRLTAVAQGPWLGRLWAESADGRRSPTVEAEVTVGVEPAGAATNVRPEGGAWTTPDLIAVWDSTLATDSAYFGGFQVQVLHGTTVLSTQTVTEARFAYAYDRYVADAAAAGVALARSLTLSVQLLDATGDPVGDPATATLTNPAPAAPAGLAVDSRAGAISVAYARPTEADYAGTQVWISAEDGFAPGAANLVYDGDGGGLIIVPKPGGTYYVRAAHYDIFGTDGLNMSGQLSVVVGSTVDTVPPGIPGNLAAGSVPHADGSTAVTLRWSAPADADLDSYEVAVKLLADSQWDYYPVPKGEDTAVKFRIPRTYAANTAINAKVLAVDTNGNRSAYSNTLTFTTGKDTVAPAAPGSISVALSPSAAYVSVLAPAGLVGLDYSFLQLVRNSTPPNADGSPSAGATDVALPRVTVAPTGAVAASFIPVTGLAPGSAQYFSARYVDTSGNYGPWLSTGPHMLPLIAAADIADAAVGAAKLASDIAPPIVVAQVPTAVSASSPALVVHQGQLYRKKPDNSGYTLEVDTANLVGRIKADQLATDMVVPIAVTSLQATASSPALVVYQGQLYRKKADNSGYTLEVDTANLVGKIKADQLATDMVVPIAVTSLQATASSPALVVYQGQLYRKKADNSGYTLDVDTADLAGQITRTQLADGAVSTPKLAANAVVAETIAAGAVTADKVAANAITAGKIAAGAVGADQIAANAITAKSIAIADTSNIITNPRFEVNGRLSTEGWELNGDARADYYPGAGISAFRLVGTNAEAYWGAYVPVSAGETYYFSAYAFQEDPAPARLLVETLNGTKFPVGYPTLASTDLKNQWVLLEAQYTVPADVMYLRLIINNGHGLEGTYNNTYWTHIVWRRAASGSLIVDGAVSADKIAANAVTTDKLSANAITAGKIAAGAVGADQIAANSVTALHLSTNSVTTDELAANAVTADKIAANAITAAKIAAGAVGADQIAANSVTAKALVVADTSNIITNPRFEVNGQPSTEGWLVGPFDTVEQASSDPVARTRIIGRSRDVFWAKHIPVLPGEAYYIAAHVYNTDQAASANIVIEQRTPQNSVLGYAYIVGTNTKNQWALLEARFTVPDGVFFIRLDLQTEREYGNRPDVLWSNVVMRRAANASMIVDGAVTTDKIAANAITADKIAANAITADKITAGTVTADKIAANAVTANKIAAGAITADKLAAGAITTSRLAIADASNIITNPRFSLNDQLSMDGWTASGASFSIESTPSDPVSPTRIRTRARSLSWDKVIPVVEGETYYVAAHVWNTNAGPAGIYIEARRGDGSVAYYAWPCHTYATNQWVFLEGQWTVPSDIKSLRFILMVDAGEPLPSDAYWCNAVFRRAVGETLIVDNAISTGKIKAGAITADKIAANAVTADHVAAGSITTGKLAANAITADKISTGAITADKLAVGNSPNLLQNSDGSWGLRCWGQPTASGNIVGGTATSGVDPEGRTPVGSHALYIAANTATPVPTDQFVEVVNAGMEGGGYSVTPGARYYYGARIGAIRCAATVFLWFYDDAGNQIGSSPLAPLYQGAWGGTRIDAFGRTEGFVTVPADCTKVVFALRMYGIGEGNPTCIATQCMLAEVLPNQTTPPLWQPAGVTQIDGASIKTGKLQSTNGLTYFDLDNNQLVIKNSETGQRMEINNSLIQVFDSNGTLRVRLGIW
ncbi:host specificity factor TipJ family phage tail protein [Oleisolibacter albus]|uniref:host specificity factor TipJ family phage tail protein n=1 Tax=Oleisolibacter albus TaxID=2171757 RepID=UPI000DF274BD|nr:host specificity factor TipJ family phage tail protein [Oleisolibacter albus]